jgi:hypothetical protein
MQEHYYQVSIMRYRSANIQSSTNHNADPDGWHSSKYGKSYSQRFVLIGCSVAEPKSGFRTIGWIELRGWLFGFHNFHFSSEVDPPQAHDYERTQFKRITDMPDSHHTRFGLEWAMERRPLNKSHSASGARPPSGECRFWLAAARESTVPRSSRERPYCTSPEAV